MPRFVAARDGVEDDAGSHAGMIFFSRR
jgi:hypothetical protein